MALQQVSTPEIKDGSVTGPLIGQNAINANNIVNGTITQAKLDPAIDLGVNPLLFAGQ
jgi:hypothetical protein